MSEENSIHILPYSLLVGQEQLKLALELAYIAPAIGGVLISGQRGTGKSTAVRAFAQMIYNSLPVTLPINATEDRVIGGWYIDKLMNTELIQQPTGIDQAKQPGLLEQAHNKLLFIDEVNLLDDHIVNIILDVTATGVLVIQREELSEQKQVAFTLVGTMNPEEGGLRPQLLDRFGLLVNVTAETESSHRIQILQTVMAFDRAVRHLRAGQTSDYLELAHQADLAYQAQLLEARQAVTEVEFAPSMATACVQIAQTFEVIGHRADYVMALAAQAYAARLGEPAVTYTHLQAVAPLAIMHRRPAALQHGQALWTEADRRILVEILPND